MEKLRNKTVSSSNKTNRNTNNNNSTLRAGGY